MGRDPGALWRLQRLKQSDRDGVGLLAGGTSGAPDADDAGCSACNCGLSLGDNGIGEKLEVMRFAKEGRLIGCYAINQFADFVAVVLHPDDIGVIVSKVSQAVVPQAARQA
jgi:hypothetical protein